MKRKNRKILLMLKTPPPFGGGEIRAAALGEYVHLHPNFLVWSVSSTKRNKLSQSRFEFWKIIEFFRRWVRYRYFLKTQRPVLVFIAPGKTFLSFFRDSLYFWTARFYGIDFACELAGRMFYFLEGNIIGRLYGRYVLKKMKFIRVLGKKIVDNFAEYGITNTLYSDNGVEIPGNATCRVELSDGTVRLLFVGTHSMQKGFEDLVDAFLHLKIKKKYPIELHTIGEWMSSEFWRHITSKKGFTDTGDSVIFHGITHGRKKWEIFANSQILALPSYNEGQPLVILEAMACGLPVVATKVGVIPETISNRENGFLFDPGDQQKLIDGLEKLIIDIELRKKISRNNLSLFQKRFSQKKYFQEQVDLLISAAEHGFKAVGQKWDSTKVSNKEIKSERYPL